MVSRNTLLIFNDVQVANQNVQENAIIGRAAVLS
jgi:hypothetical protein